MKYTQKMETYASKGLKAKSRIPVSVNCLNKQSVNKEINIIVSTVQERNNKSVSTVQERNNKIVSTVQERKNKIASKVQERNNKSVSTVQERNNKIVSTVQERKNKIASKVQERNKIASKVQERNKTVSKVQSSKTKTTNPSYLPSVLLKESTSQQPNVEKPLNDRLKNNSKFKENRQPALKSNIKAVNSKGKDRLLKTWTKPDGKREKTSPPKDQLLSKSKAKFCDKNKEKQSTLKPAPNKMEEFSTPKDMLKEIKITSKMDCFTAQKDIKFEANEAYRNMILRGRELSPSVCNLMPGFRLSSIQSQRPSAYQKNEISANPLKDTMEALEKFSLSLKSKREQKSVKTGCQVFSSPLKDKSFFYTPHQDPKREVMKSLEKVKLKQLQKSVLRSTKKVTFDLNIKDCTPKNPCDTELNSFKNSENRLTQISEKSEENTPNSPENERIPASTLKQNKENSPTSVWKENKNFFNHPEIQATSEINDAKTYKWDNPECSTFCTTTKQLPTVLPKDTNTEKLSSIQCKEHSNSNNVHDLQIMDETSTKYLNALKEKKLNAENIQNTQTKVYTPRPVSLYSKSGLTNSSSPEFLEQRTSEALLKMAPICTPLVLKSLSKMSVRSPDVDLSPVRLKLDFSEKHSPKKETSKNHKHVALENIVTSKSILDALADEECCLFLIETVPILCGRYLTDPVASTLTEGDEMHFIPIEI